MTIDDKLDKIIGLLEKFGAGAVLPGSKAYDNAQLDVSQVKTDGSVNPDGSIWEVSPITGAIERIYFGYISPSKTPEIWEFYKNAVTPDVFAAWDAEWRANPYGIYRADASSLIKKGVMNFVLFGELVRSAKTYIQ